MHSFWVKILRYAQDDIDAEVFMTVILNEAQRSEESPKKNRMQNDPKGMLKMFSFPLFKNRRYL